MGEALAPVREHVVIATKFGFRIDSAGLVDLVARIAGRKRTTPAQVALAWPLAQGPWIVPIPGTTKLSRLEENLGAVELELAPEDLRDIESAASKIALQGARYPEHLQKLVGR